MSDKITKDDIKIIVESLIEITNNVKAIRDSSKKNLGMRSLETVHYNLVSIITKLG